MDIIWIDTVDSTNSEARRRIDHLSNLSVISATEQTAGRGQRDNIWLSARGQNLTFSIVLKYGEDHLREIRPADQSVISDITSQSVVEFLSKYGIEAWIKWPNDVYVGDNKICGMLIEHSIKGNALSHSIIGVGLNVNQTEFDDSIPDPTSIRMETADKYCESYDLKFLLGELMDIFKKNMAFKIK